MSFYHEFIDPLADTFFIDPDLNNPRAIHVYSKAGFEKVGAYEANVGGFCWPNKRSDGEEDMSKNIIIVPALLGDYLTIQNMARFDIYIIANPERFLPLPLLLHHENL